MMMCRQAEMSCELPTSEEDQCIFMQVHRFITANRGVCSSESLSSLQGCSLKTAGW